MLLKYFKFTFLGMSTWKNNPKKILTNPPLEVHHHLKHFSDFYVTRRWLQGVKNGITSRVENFIFPETSESFVKWLVRCRTFYPFDRPDSVDPYRFRPSTFNVFGKFTLPQNRSLSVNWSVHYQYFEQFFWSSTLGTAYLMPFCTVYYHFF